MNTIRIGNDIDVVWKILSRNGVKYSIEGKDVDLWLVSGPFKKKIEDFQVSMRNQVSFSLDASDLRRYGVYKLVLVIKNPTADNVDASFEVSSVFQVVSDSYVDSSDAVLDGEAIRLTLSSVLNNIETSTLEGASAYEIAVENGFTGSEREWLASLKGEQGNSGYSGDISELEVVNNLTQGGAISALSAEMGKRLKQHVDNLEAFMENHIDLSESEYEALVASGRVNPDAFYFTHEDEEEES